MSTFNLEDSAAMVTITGYVGIVHKYVPEKYGKLMPLVAIAVGIGYAFAIKPGPVMSASQSIALGVMLGLSACGAYSSTKAGVEFAKEMKAGKS